MPKRRRTKSDISQLVRHYMRLLGMDGWTYTIRTVRGLTGWSAQVRADPKRNHFDMEFSPLQFQQDEDPVFTLETLVVHELMHVKMSPLVHYLGREQDMDHGAIWLEEMVVSGITQVLVGSLPRVGRGSRKPR